ncbi:hypothetical protein PO878_19900 [Iamia majanohamensis]|uniref:Lipoprotein n=1 Tax=Iamia majanohamensis TaxID=467976 RepID=A0AAF0BVW3_9ACTN|nr:hypothetical protein [Iamia majanohamensis]WCO66759.1 hypothetical protein PO878_19900 [Iamia majanohamensis]
MTQSRPCLRLAAAALALVLVVAACSDDGDDDAEATTTTQAEETTTTAADDAGDEGSDDTTDDTTDDDGGDEGDDDADPDAEATAESVILVASDFRSDWTSEAPTPDGEELLDCVSDQDVDEVLEAEVDSDEFSLADATGDNVLGASSTGLVMADEEAATALLDEIGTNQFAGCALDQLVDGFEEDGATVIDADLSPAGDAYGVGDQSVTLNGFFSIEGDDGSTVDGELSLTMVRTGEVVTGVSVFGIGETSFPATTDEVVGVIADRHEAELG